MSGGDNLGRQFHPHVDHYRDGGMGGIGEDHSVVGFVPTEHLKVLREWDRADPTAVGSDYSRERINSLRADLRAGKGFHTPLMVEYNHHENWAYLGEGNHRLAAALEEHVPVVPVRVARSEGRPASRKQQGIGGHITHDPIPGAEHDPSYVPSDIHPRYLFGENNERAPLSANQFKNQQTDDIMRLL